MTLRTTVGISLLNEMRKPLITHLECIDNSLGIESSVEIGRMRILLNEARTAHLSEPDEVFNDLFLLEELLQLFEHYGKFWFLLANFKFTDSWNELQNAFDSIRLIRRFTDIDISGIEDQLYEIESAYPYEIFFSIGVIVEKFECSICGEDIDSFDCIHRKGELYRGQMAFGKAKNIERLDHVAMVKHPVDKRCVISYENDAPQFEVVRYISSLLSSKQLKISKFGGIAWVKRRISNPEHKDLPRNTLCYCGSRQKFKKCCINKAFVENDHAQIFPANSLIERIRF